jgi:hypothetical protein
MTSQYTVASVIKRSTSSYGSNLSGSRIRVGQIGVVQFVNYKSPVDDGYIDIILQRKLLTNPN